MSVNKRWKAYCLIDRKMESNDAAGFKATSNLYRAHVAAFARRPDDILGRNA